MPRPVIIVDYDPYWPVLFEAEKARLLLTLGDKLVALEHIGSTAVPGLSAKPIIDLMAGVRDQDHADEIVPLVAPLGYTDVTREPENGEWFYCLGRQPDEGPQYHLHLVVPGSVHWERQLRFRDILRARPDLTQQYDTLKRELAERYRNDRTAYTDAKSAFIESVLREG